MDAASYWSSYNSQVMAMASVDYCVHRQTSMSTICMAWLREHWDHLQHRSQSYIIVTILKAVARGTAGVATIDSPKWRDLAWDLYRRSSEIIQSDVRARLRVWPEIVFPDFAKGGAQ